MTRVFLAALCLATPAAADLRSEAEALIDASFHEHRIVVNCVDQSPQTQELAATWMPQMIEDAQDQLIEIGFTPEEIGALMARARYTNMLLPDDATVGELRALCAEDPDWLRRFQFMDIILLPSALQELIDSQ